MRVVLQVAFWIVGLALATLTAAYLLLLVAGPACGCADGPDEHTSEWYSANGLKHPPSDKPVPQRPRTLEEIGL